jgi:hypothetical protein
MTSDNYLFIFIVSLLLYTLYSILTNKTSPEDVKEMLDNEEW